MDLKEDKKSKDYKANKDKDDKISKRKEYLINSSKSKFSSKLIKSIYPKQTHSGNKSMKHKRSSTLGEEKDISEIVNTTSNHDNIYKEKSNLKIENVRSVNYFCLKQI